MWLSAVCSHDADVRFSACWLLHRYAVAFYFGLRNTLVADNLDEATKIAYKGNRCVWRVVTRSGELIDTTGTMSGGGKRVRRGAMKAAASVSKEEADAAAKDLERYQAQLMSCRNMMTLLATEVCVDACCGKSPLEHGIHRGGCLRHRNAVLTRKFLTCVSASPS